MGGVVTDYNMDSNKAIRGDEPESRPGSST